MTSTLRKRIKIALVVAGALVLAYIGSYVCYRTATLQSPEEYMRRYGHPIGPFVRALVVKHKLALHFFGPLMEFDRDQLGTFVVFKDE